MKRHKKRLAKEIVGNANAKTPELLDDAFKRLRVNLFAALERNESIPLANRRCMECERGAMGKTLGDHECDPDDLAHLARYPVLRRRGRIQYLLEDWLQRRGAQDYAESDNGVGSAMARALWDERLLDDITLRETRYFCWKYMATYLPELADEFKTLFKRSQGW